MGRLIGAQIVYYGHGASAGICNSEVDQDKSVSHSLEDIETA